MNNNKRTSTIRNVKGHIKVKRKKCLYGFDEFAAVMIIFQLDSKTIKMRLQLEGDT